MLDRDTIRRVAEDKLRNEIALARAGDGASLPSGPWPDELRIDANGLGADSLEVMSLAAALNEMFHIHEHGTEDFLLARRTFGQWVDIVLEAHRANPGRISFQTSGSTGLPKRCVHDLARMVAEADEHAARLRPGRVLSAVPSHHIYGFIFSVLLPLRAGCPVVDIRHRLPREAEVRSDDILVSFPDHWRYLARSLDQLPSITGVTSSAPMPAALARDLRARGLARLVEIYGSSETAGLGWRDDPDHPYALLQAWSVRDAPPDQGQLHLMGPSGTPASTPDIVTMAGARTFHVLRRADGALQVGGINVYPQQVACTLEKHPMVAHARVRLASPNQGGRLKALLVPKDPAANAAAVRTAVETWMKTQLSGPEWPRSLTIAPALPQAALGKDADWVELT